RLGLTEATRAILGRIIPTVRRVANEAADGRLSVAEIQPFHNDELVDDGGNLARDFGALRLEVVTDKSAEFVRRSLKDARVDDVRVTRALHLVEPGQHLTGVQAVSCPGVLGAVACEAFRLLLAPGEGKPAQCGEAVDKDHPITIEVLERSADRVVMRR